MNEQLQNALTEILNHTISGIDSSVAFMEAQLPDVVEQMLLWYMVKGLLFTLAGVAIFLAPFIFLLVAHKKGYTGIGEASDYSYKPTLTHDNQGDPFAFSIGASITVIITTTVSAMLINLEWLQIWLAPKLWLIEYTAGLVK